MSKHLNLIIIIIITVILVIQRHHFEFETVVVLINSFFSLIAVRFVTVLYTKLRSMVAVNLIDEN